MQILRQNLLKLNIPRSKMSLFVICVLIGNVPVTKLSAQKSNTVSRAASSGENSLLSRGRYIVDGVAMCGQCHTPRTDAGQLDSSKWLDGAALWLEPAAPTRNWPLKAPRLAGNPPASDSDLVTLLSTGAWPDGTHLRPPMPQFHMTREDAEAVVAYLKSLTPHSEDAP